jgi:hypothetical protein
MRSVGKVVQLVRAKEASSVLAGTSISRSGIMGTSHVQQIVAHALEV